MADRFTVKQRVDTRRAGTGSEIRYTVDGYTDDGVRVRKYFPTRAAAAHEANKLNAEASRTGILGSLTDAERVEAEECFKKCRAVGVSLNHAVNAYLDRREKTEVSATVGEAYAHMLDDKRDRGSLYLSQLKNMLKPFVTEHRDRRMEGFDTMELDAFIRKQPGAAKSRNNLRGYLCILWNHAVKKGLTADNPAKNTTLAVLPAKDPEFATPACLRAIIAITKVQCPTSITPFMIQAFAGLRTCETAKLDWADVNLEERHISVTTGKAKTKSRRTVPISEALHNILAQVAKEAGPVTATCHDEEFTIIRRAVRKLGHKWPHNALRHSFVSYRLSETENDAATALEAGHTQTMLHRHYKGLARRTAATEWFAIRPDDIPPANIKKFTPPRKKKPTGRPRGRPKGPLPAK